MAKAKTKSKKKSVEEHNKTVVARRILAKHAGSPEMKKRARRAEVKSFQKAMKKINEKHFGEGDKKAEKKSGSAEIAAKGMRVSKAALDAKKRLEFHDQITKENKSKKNQEHLKKVVKVGRTKWGKDAKYTPGSRKQESHLERLKSARKDPAKKPESFQDRLEASKKGKTPKQETKRPEKGLKRRIAEKLVEGRKRQESTKDKYDARLNRTLEKHGDQRYKKENKSSGREPSISRGRKADRMYDKQLSELHGIRKKMQRAQTFNKIKTGLSVGAEIGKAILAKTWDVAKAGFKLGKTGIERGAAHVKQAVEQKRNNEVVNKIKEHQRKQMIQQSMQQGNQQQGDSGGAQMKQKPVQPASPMNTNKKRPPKPATGNSSPKSPFHTGFSFSTLSKKVARV